MKAYKLKIKLDRESTTQAVVLANNLPQAGQILRNADKRFIHIKQKDIVSHLEHFQLKYSSPKLLLITTSKDMGSRFA